MWLLCRVLAQVTAHGLFEVYQHRMWCPDQCLIDLLLIYVLFLATKTFQNAIPHDVLHGMNCLSFIIVHWLHGQYTNAVWQLRVVCMLPTRLLIARYMST